MKNITAYLSFLFMLFTAPFDWSDYFLVTFSNLYKYFFIGFIIYLLIHYRSKIRIAPYVFIIIFIQTVVCFVLFFFDDIGTHLNTTISLIVIIAFSILIESKLINIELFIKLFLLLMVVVSFSVLLSVLLAYFGLIDLIELNSDTYLIGISLSKDIIINTGDRILFRPGGLFTEPGMLSTFLIFSLFLNQVTYKIKLLNLLFIFTGLVSLSFLFMIFIPIYICVTTNLLKSLLIFIILILLIVFISGYLDSSLTASVLSRISNGNSFAISNNRAHLIEEGLRNIYKIKLLGSSFSELNPLIDIDATWIGFFFRYGWLAGFFLFLHNLLIFNYNRINATQIFIFAFICILFYQRPFIISFSYYIFILLIRKHFQKKLFFAFAENKKILH